MAESAFTPPRQMTQDLSIIRIQSQVILRHCQTDSMIDLDDLRYRVREMENATARIQAMLGEGDRMPSVDQQDQAR